MAKQIRRALTIAGSDSGGGAGIQADLKTFAALGVYGTSVLTALTAQNTLRLSAIHCVPAEFVDQQIAAVAEDIGIDAAKTGMLAGRGIVETVARAVERYDIERLVVDPVFVSRHGVALLADEAVDSYINVLLPRALIVTPNADEAARLAGFEVKDREAQRRAARVIAGMGPRYVLVKGGHVDDDESAVDVLFDGRCFQELSAPRIATADTHGTGCTLSAAIAAYLARGEPPESAIALAKEFVTRAIEHGLRLGGGAGPVNPMWTFGEK